MWGLWQTTIQARDTRAQSNGQDSSAEAFWATMRKFYEEIWRDNSPGVTPGVDHPRRCIDFPLDTLGNHKAASRQIASTTWI